MSAPEIQSRVPHHKDKLGYSSMSVRKWCIVETDVVGAILGVTGLPRYIIGEVDIRDRNLFVKVASEHAPGIIAKLNPAQIKGRKAKVKAA
jgi:DbpA RNA binding domain